MLALWISSDIVGRLAKRLNDDGEEVREKAIAELAEKFIEAGLAKKRQRKLSATKKAGRLLSTVKRKGVRK